LSYVRSAKGAYEVLKAPPISADIDLLDIDPVEERLRSGWACSGVSSIGLKPVSAT